MKQKIYSVIIIVFSIIILECSSQKVFASDASISASKTKIEKGNSVTITANVSSASSWDLDISTSGGTLKKSNDRVGNTDSGNNENKTVNLGTFVSDQDGTYTIKLSGYVVDGDTLSRKNVSGDVTITVISSSANNDNSGNNQGNTGGSSGKSDATPAVKSTEARLSNFGIKPNDFSGFKKDKTEYSTEVPNSVSKVNVYATALDQKAKVTGTGDVQLKEGDNTVKVTVTAEAGNTKTYTLTIKRKAETETVENTNINDSKGKVGLSSIEIKGFELSPSFKTETYQYTVDLEQDLTSLEISTIPVDDDTTVEIIGNENLKDGENIITILVNNKKTDKTATYQITVNKSIIEEIDENAETEPSQAMSWLKPSTWGKEEIIKVILIIVLIILIVIAIVLKIKLLKEKKETQNIDLPGADELDKALAEHQELSELEEKENSNFEDINTDESYNDIRKKGKGKHF